MLSHKYALVSLLAVAAGIGIAKPALAQSRQVTSANTTTVESPVSVVLNGNTFVNQGLVGVGRLGANTLDFAGETLGSFSGMAMDLTTWRRNADGTYSGGIYTLPDRGPNDVGPFVGTTNYRNRVHTSVITLNPYTGTTILPQSTTSQSQLTIAPTGGFFLTDTTGTNFTGRDAAGNVVTRAGVLYPVVASGEGVGRVSLDSEAIAFRPDGSFYVADEYAANIYYFDPTGHQLGALNTIPAIRPIVSGAVNFNGGAAPTTGRRNNQGLEALAITPDNRSLVTILQSATVQDTAGSAQATRNNTRILVYDISGNSIPSGNPIGHYVLQLPIFNQNGTGAAPDRTAAQSEMLALNSSQFLVLSRDGIGRGSTPTTSTTPIFKSILLVDISAATNLAGTQYETGTTPIATGGTLVSGIVPAAQVELVNMLNVTQLNRFGMNLNTRPTNITSVSEKWEAMGLAPVLEENAPQDFFLFVGNDNDFQANNGFINGQSYDGSLSGVGGTGNNDSVILVYRLSLPTYVDPQALAALNSTAPGVLYGTRLVMNGLGMSTTQPAMRHMATLADAAIVPDAPRYNLWIDGSLDMIGAGTDNATGFDVDMTSATMGIDMRLSDAAHIGAFGGYRQFEGPVSAASRVEGDGWTAGAYAAVELANGLYLHATGAWLGDVTFDEIGRASAYGQQAIGVTSGEGLSGSGELGWHIPLGWFEVTPFVAADYVDLTLDGYSEHGASVSNLTFAEREFQKLNASVGGEVAARFGALRPALRGGYSFETEYGDESSTVRLTSAKHAMGTVNLPLGLTERNSAFGELRVAASSGPVTLQATAGGRWGQGEDDTRMTAGVNFAF